MGQNTAIHPAPSLYFNQYCVMKKRDILPMNEMDRKCYKIVPFSYQYQIFEIRICYYAALMVTFNIP